MNEETTRKILMALYEGTNRSKNRSIYDRRGEAALRPAT
jgi:hypothetical protein